MENNKFTIVALVVAIVALGLSAAGYVQHSNTQAGGNNQTVTVNGSSPSYPSEDKFGAVQYSTIGGGVTAQGNVTSTGSFQAASTWSLGVNAGTAATGTFTGTTSTLSLPGRFCLNALTNTGTRMAIFATNDRLNPLISVLNARCDQ